jgi:hypothetical protein
MVSQFKEPIILDGEDWRVTVHLKNLSVFQSILNINNLSNPVWRWDHEAELIVSDNLGNVYKVPYNGGSTDGSARTREDFNWTATLRGLNSQATFLTLYPIAQVSRFNTETEESESKHLEFDAIKVDLINQSHSIVEDPTIPRLPEEDLE